MDSKSIARKGVSVQVRPKAPRSLAALGFLLVAACSEGDGPKADETPHPAAGSCTYKFLTDVTSCLQHANISSADWEELVESNPWGGDRYCHEEMGNFDAIWQEGGSCPKDHPQPTGACRKTSEDGMVSIDFRYNCTNSTYRCGDTRSAAEIQADCEAEGGEFVP